MLGVTEGKGKKLSESVITAYQCSTSGKANIIQWYTGIYASANARKASSRAESFGGFRCWLPEVSHLRVSQNLTGGL